MFKTISRIPGAVFVWMVSYLFFIACLANNFSASHDSINYLHQIVKGEGLFHQHHLLYHFVANKWLILLRSVFPGVAPHYLVESFTAFWGSGVLAICYLFFRNRFGVGKVLSLLGVLVIAFSYGTWFYSVNVEVYMPPMFFILCSLYVITKTTPQQTDIWMIGLLHAMAVLFHQVNILFCIVALFWIVSNRKAIHAGKALLAYVVTGLLLVGGAYIIIGWFVEGHDNITAFSDWLLGYTVGHGYWRPFGAESLVQVLTGFSRAFIGAHFVFQLPSVKDSLQSSFHSHSLTDEVFLSQQIGAGMAWVLAALTVVFVLMMLTLVVRSIEILSALPRRRTLVFPLVICLAVYAVFFTFWMPEILEFWILQMVIVWLLVIGTLPSMRLPFRFRRTTWLGILAVVLFAINYTGSMKWLQRAENDWYYVEVKKISGAGAGDLVIIEDNWILKDYVRYFTSAEVIATDEPSFDREEASRRVRKFRAADGKVYLYGRRGGESEKPGWHLIQSY